MIRALRVDEVDTLGSPGTLGPVLCVMGSADSRWRFDPYCEVVAPE